MQGVHNAIRMMHARVMQVNVPVTDMTLVVDSVTAMERVHVIVVSVVAMGIMQVVLVNVTLILRALVIHLSVHVMDMLLQLVLVIPLVNV